jgi:hypothetical protein
MTKAQTLIIEAMLEIEKMGCDTRLTNAVVLLEKAKEELAEFVVSVKEEK